MDILEKLKLKFTSGNSVPVDSARITREDYGAILDVAIQREQYKQCMLHLSRAYTDWGMAMEDSLQEHISDMIRRAETE